MNIPVFAFPVTTACSCWHLRTARARGGRGTSSCANLATPGYGQAPQTSRASVSSPPRGINYTHCSVIFIFLKKYKHIVSKSPLVYSALRTKMKSPQIIPVSGSPNPSSTFQGQLHLTPEALSSVFTFMLGFRFTAVSPLLVIVSTGFPGRQR